jgi:hypothetical protein
MKFAFTILFLFLFGDNILSSDQVTLNHIKSTINLNQDFPNLKQGKEFKKTLSSLISVSWKNRQLRDGIQSLSRHYGISIILDRRVNPNKLMNLNIKDTSLINVLKKTGGTSQASLSILPGAIYIGPEHVSSSLRSLIFVKQLQIEEFKTGTFSTRKISIQWNDLDQPRKIFENVVREFQITVGNIDLIPHDLWTSGSLSGVPFSEIASIILIQYNLTFEWNQNDKITLVPVSYPVSISKSYNITRKQLKKIVPEFQQDSSFPKIDIQKRIVSFKGSIEQHEKFHNRLTGKKLNNSVNNKPISLDRRQFTLKLKAGSAEILINLLRKNGIPIEYDEEAFESSGIDLKEKIEVDLKKASINELLDSFCKPLNIEYKIRDNIIYLVPIRG